MFHGTFVLDIYIYIYVATCVHIYAYMVMSLLGGNENGFHTWAVTFKIFTYLFIYFSCLSALS